MSTATKTKTGRSTHVRIQRTLKRFTMSQRWEHALLFISVTILLVTGLPQKFRTTEWSQTVITSPTRLESIQNIHHIAAILLALVVVFHLGNIILHLILRKLPGDMLPTGKDVQDAWHMLLYLLFLKQGKPKFGKYNFEQKVTYWFIFFAMGILGISGLINWFPETFTRFLPGGIVPAAKLAHSTEAMMILVFLAIWHFYHVHIERLNLSIFTGYLNEDDLRTYHQLEHQRLIARKNKKSAQGDIQE